MLTGIKEGRKRTRKIEKEGGEKDDQRRDRQIFE
jgi:hypothetical protein